jgi:hypothetical protein
VPVLAQEGADACCINEAESAKSYASESELGKEAAGPRGDHEVPPEDPNVRG